MEDEHDIMALLTLQSKAIDKFVADTKAEVRRIDEIEKRMNRPGFLSVGGTASDPVALTLERKAFSHYLRTGSDAELKGTEADFSETKSLSIGSDPDGGYVVSPYRSSVMMSKLFDLTPMRRLARTEIITKGDAWEEVIDVNDIQAEWVGETESRPETDTAKLGELRVPLHEIYANQKVTQRLLDDSAFDVGGWVDGKTTDKFARTEGVSFVNGLHPKKPTGFMTYSSSAVTTADATRAWGKLQYTAGGDASAILADGLKSLVWSLRAPYRPGAVWLLNSNTASQVDKLKASGTGDYIWRDGMTAGAPPSLLGYPVEFSEDMPDVSGNAFPIAFGNFKAGYLIVDRPGDKSLRDPFTSKPNVMFYTYRRVGGGVANFEAIKLLKIATS